MCVTAGNRAKFGATSYTAVFGIKATYGAKLPYWIAARGRRDIKIGSCLGVLLFDVPLVIFQHVSERFPTNQLFKTKKNESALEACFAEVRDQLLTFLG